MKSFNPVNTNNPLLEFKKTITKEENLSPSYYNWSDDRLGQLVLASIATQELIVQEVSEEEFFMVNHMILAQTLKCLDIIKFNLQFSFAGTKEFFEFEVFIRRVDGRLKADRIVIGNAVRMLEAAAYAEIYAARYARFSETVIAMPQQIIDIHKRVCTCGP